MRFIFSKTIRCADSGKHARSLAQRFRTFPSDFEPPTYIWGGTLIPGKKPFSGIRCPPFQKSTISGPISKERIGALSSPPTGCSCRYLPNSGTWNGISALDCFLDLAFESVRSTVRWELMQSQPPCTRSKTCVKIPFSSAGPEPTLRRSA